ncbi:MAG: serine/threonine protein kinase, partial [Planctomycetes bacterium]|nr:serine/threonine protein kinase [Planctomycetota bacterium]
MTENSGDSKPRSDPAGTDPGDSSLDTSESGRGKSSADSLRYFKNKVRYRREGVLGRGGMAVVYRYVDEYFQRGIALKKLRPERRNPNHIKEFVKEARIIGQLEHPGIIHVHDLNLKKQDDPLITMSIAEGEPLNKVIDRYRDDPNSWKLADRVSMFGKLVDILDYAHNKGFIHRDLKPSNISVGPLGEVTVLDWGLAKQLDSEDRLMGEEGVGDISQTLDGTIKGTPFYMSPEAAKGLNALVDEKSDLFSLGAILFECIYFRHLIKGSNVNEVLKNAMQSNYDTEGLDPTIIPEDLFYILKKCIAPDRNKRYENLSQLALDIYAYQNGLPLADFRHNYSYRIKKWFTRNWGQFLFLTLAGAGLLWLIGVLLLNIQQQVEQIKHRAVSINELKDKGAKFKQSQL